MQTFISGRLVIGDSVRRTATEEELRIKAEKVAQAKVAFYIHLTVYILVNAMLIGIWWWSLGPTGFPWFLFPLIGWGIGLAAHGVGTFAGPMYVERQTERELQKLRAEQQKK